MRENSAKCSCGQDSYTKEHFSRHGTGWVTGCDKCCKHTFPFLCKEDSQQYFSQTFKYDN